MGIAESIANEMARHQKEAQDRMSQKQTEQMLINGERMRRTQMATMMAVTRERFWWLSAWTGLMLAGMTHAFIVKKGHPAMIPPALGFVFITAYHWDMAYGSKMNRINKMADDIMTDPSIWFVPITPTEKQIEHLKELGKVKPDSEKP